MGKFLLLMLVLFGFYCYYDHSAKQAQVAPFNGVVSQYSALSHRKKGRATEAKGRKVLPIDMKSSTVDDSYFNLPFSIRPIRPDEVGAVAQVRYHSQPIGVYKRNGIETLSRGHIWLADVVVINPQQETELATASFTGGLPPSEKKGSGDAYGSRPTTEIAKWITQLAE